MKKINDEDGDESVLTDDDADDVGCIDLSVGSDSDAYFEVVLCIETKLPDVVVSDFDSDVQLN